MEFNDSMKHWGRVGVTWGHFGITLRSLGGTWEALGVILGSLCGYFAVALGCIGHGCGVIGSVQLPVELCLASSFFYVGSFVGAFCLCLVVFGCVSVLDCVCVLGNKTSNYLCFVFVSNLDRAFGSSVCNVCMWLLVSTSISCPVADWYVDGSVVVI